MQSSGKGYLPRNDLKEDVSDYAVIAKDQGNGGAAVADLLIATSEISRSCN